MSNSLVIIYIRHVFDDRETQPVAFAARRKTQNLSPFRLGMIGFHFLLTSVKIYALMAVEVDKPYAKLRGASHPSGIPGVGEVAAFVYSASEGTLNHKYHSAPRPSRAHELEKLDYSAIQDVFTRQFPWKIRNLIKLE